ncbi:hypothetical protein RB195_023053 [Necator americanus]|uniref:Uncharacterized protein n=1 Tax=Necator americanus TaxID=51031 RepID=A0ABR1EHZ1_NECAM
MGRHKRDKRRSQSEFIEGDDDEAGKHLRCAQSTLELYSKRRSAKNDEAISATSDVLPIPLLTRVNKLNAVKEAGIEDSSPCIVLARSEITEKVSDENMHFQDSREHLRDLSARALNGMNALDFRDRMLSSLRTYKAMSALDCGSRPVFQPFLRRNLLYLMAFADRVVPTYTFGEDEPPLLWPWKPVYNIPRRAIADRRVRELSDVRSFQFSVGALAAFKRTMDVKILHHCLAYRKFLRARGMSVPFPRKRVESSIGNIVDNRIYHSLLSEDSATLSFRMVFHNFLEGERLAKVQVYIVQQRGKSFGKVERLPSATFTVSVNAPMQPVAIDLPAIFSDSPLRVYVIVRVDVTNNLKGVRVDARASKESIRLLLFHNLRNVMFRLDYQRQMPSRLL